MKNIISSTLIVVPTDVGNNFYFTDRDIKCTFTSKKCLVVHLIDDIYHLHLSMCNGYMQYCCMPVRDDIKSFCLRCDSNEKTNLCGFGCIMCLICKKKKNKIKKISE